MLPQLRNVSSIGRENGMVNPIGVQEANREVSRFMFAVPAGVMFPVSAPVL